jgi:hypothetical protein
LTVRSLLDRLRAHWRHLPARRWLFSDHYLMVWAIDRAHALPPDDDDGLHRNSTADLELFEQTERWLSPQAFAAEARRRLDDGLHVYTAVQGRRLVHYVWLVPLQAKAWFPHVGQEYLFPPGTAVMFNDYTHPAARGHGLHQRSMRRRIWDSLQRPEIEWVYVATESHNHASRKVATRAGLRCMDVLYEHCRLGKVQRGRIDPEQFLRSEAR